MVLPIPYARVVVAGVMSAAVLAVVLNLHFHDWAMSLHLASVGVFEVITLALVVRSLVIWIVNRRKPDEDPPGSQRDFGLAG